LAGIAKDGTNDAARVAAACALLDRGWGKPPQARTGENGEALFRSQSAIWSKAWLTGGVLSRLRRRL
jgi:hypothetical protein